MNGFKRAFVLVLIVFLMVPAFLGSVFAAGSGEVSRGEWISQLVSTFKMTVDDASTMPDNYYSDMTMESPYYNDVLLAVEFGVIDLDAGLPFRPGDPATREFAAHTLNFCLGFQLEDSNYTFNEYGSVTYPDDIQVAINRGWFAMSGSSFKPEQAITSAEMQGMFEDAQQVLALDASVVGSENTAEFSSEIIEIPAEAELTFDEYNNITISGFVGSLNVNDTFVVYIEGYPMAFIATAVQENVDGSITVSTTREGIDMSLFTSFDYSGSQSGDLENFVPSGDASYYITDMSSKTNAAPQLLTIETYGVDYDKNNKTLTATKNFKIDGASAGSITIKLTNISFEHDESLIKGYAKAVVTADIDVSGSVSFDFNNYAGIPKSILLGKVSIVPLMCSVELSLEIDLSGGLSTNWSGDLKAGFVYDKEQFRLLKDFNKKEFSFTAEAELRIGLELSGELNLVLASGSVYARAGVQMNFKLTAYDSGTPSTCVSLSGYLYASMGANASVMFDIKTWSKTQDIFTQSNSPVRVSYHYEDGALVSSCTRGSGGADEPFYCTPVSSPYFNPSPSYSQSYDDGSGTPVQLYSYEAEEDDAGVEYAVITGYNGGASALAIPSEIDGYEVREIGKSAFYNDDNIRSVVIPSSVTEIGVQAFGGCDALSNVQLSSNLQRLNYSSFGNCPSLKEIHIPKSLTEVGTSYWTGSVNLQGGPFDGSGLTAVTFEEGTTAVLGGLFYDATSLRDVALLDSMTSIGGSAFRNCTSLESIELPNSITSIGNYAFYMCEGLKAINIPDSVTAIGAMAFQGCTDLGSVKLSNNLLELNYSSFGNCPSLKEIHIPKSLTEVGTSYWTGSVNLQGGPFDGSGLTAVTFEEGTTAVLGGLFYDATSLRDVALLDSMTFIGGSAFRNCTSLETIELPNSITSIGSNAFYMCESLESISIPDSVLSIGTFAFYGCESIVSIKLPQGIDSIGERTFTNCASLEYIDLPDPITIIGDYAFSGCANLTSIKLPGNLSKINTHAFDGNGLTSVIFPDACEVIESYAFVDNTKLAEVTLPSSLREIGANCFENCDALTSIIIPDSVNSLSTYVFNDCDLLAEVDLGKGITEIMRNTFSNCPALNNVVIPYGVTKIGSSAFANCTGLTSITIPRTVTSIETNAFSYKDRMTIYGVPGTYAETFAQNNGFKFVSQEHNATSVDLNVTELTLNRGQSYQLTYSVEPPNSTDEVFWRTTDNSVVTVTNDGLITARAVGTATVLLNIGDNASAQCEVTVVQPVTSVSLNYSSRAMDVLETLQLTASVRPNNAYNKGVTWSSSDTSVASVDDTGLVTAYKKGEATITVTAVDGSGESDSCDITVNGNPAYSAEQLESSHNYANNSDELWVLRAEGATYIEVTFDAQTSLEQNMDYLYVYGFGEEPGDGNKYTGTELAGKTIRVLGDTVKIKLVSDQIGNRWGFKVTNLKTDGALDPYAEIRAGLTAAAALETDSAKLEAVRALDSDLLAEAMALEDGSVAEIVKQLESGMNVDAQVVVTEEMKNQFSADEIDLTGAAMNVSSASSPVTLTIDTAQSAGSSVGTQYSNVVDFSMTLGNAVEPLEVPVMLTMPVPKGIDPDSLVIIHELKDGSTERIEYNISYPEEGTAYVSFVVTGFSDFRMAQAVNDVRAVEISGSTASVEVFCSAANTSVICASYDPNGKMLSVDAETLSAATNWQDVSLSVAAGAYRVGILLIDGSHKPLAESLQFIV